MTYHRSSIKGAASFRRLLKRLPDSANAELIKMLQAAGPVLAENMKARLPSRTGALRGGISYKVTPTTLNLKVGLLGTPKGRAKLFYGHILDTGIRAQIAKVRRGPRAGSTVRVRARAGLHVESAGLRDFRAEILPNYRKLMDRILLDAARGAGND